ncbi:MAG TPA: ribosome silencing factor [Candidatus Eisenbacteria bacterium]|nr:ribosome silencing factor [Candidatus Eisenbacteria bacterium]
MDARPAGAVTKGPRPEPSRGDGGRELALRAVQLAREKKGEDLVLLDLRELSSVADYFLLVTALSETQVRAIAEHIWEKMGQEGSRPWHVEGMEHRRWVLLDFVDVVVHVFHPETRQYYLLERLWGDAARVPLPEE